MQSLQFPIRIFSPPRPQFPDAPTPSEIPSLDRSEEEEQRKDRKWDMGNKSVLSTPHILFVAWVGTVEQIHPLEFFTLVSFNKVLVQPWYIAADILIKVVDERLQYNLHLRRKLNVPFQRRDFHVSIFAPYSSATVSKTSYD